MMLSKSILKPVLSLTLAAAVLAPGAAFASTVRITPSMNAFFGKQKMVHFNLRNQSGAAIELRAGDQVMTVENGKTAELKLVPGTRIVTTTKTEKREAGAVVCEVTSAINDTTVVLN